MREETGRLLTSGGGNSSEFRIRDNLTNTLTRKFVETMKDYQNAQSKVRKEVLFVIVVGGRGFEAFGGLVAWRSGLGLDCRHPHPHPHVHTHAA
jgi:hypothetical protein